MSAPDHNDLAQLQEQLLKHSMRLAAMTAQVAKARQVLGFEGDRKKALLSKYVAGYLELGDSVSAAEHKARAHPEYGKGMASIYAQSGSAHQVMEERDVVETQWRTAQSLVSLQKTVLDNL